MHSCYSDFSALFANPRSNNYSFFMHLIKTVVITTYTGNALPEDISSLAADRMLVYAANGKLISAFAKNKEVKCPQLEIYCTL